MWIAIAVGFLILIREVRMPDALSITCAPKMKTSYVLVTAARDEAATISQTIRSVVAQSILPAEWIIVSDGSIDQTDAIVESYAARFPFIRLLRLQDRPSRNFASCVFALEAGIAALRTKDHGFIGLLDADLRFGEDYFDSLMKIGQYCPQLGLIGGRAIDAGDPNPRFKDLRDVAGAVQFFSRACFEAVLPLAAIPEGGWDAITNVRARQAGFLTRTIPELPVDHLKPRNVAAGGILRRTWQLGVRDYALGYHPVYMIGKCLSRLTERPAVVSASCRMLGFLWSTLTQRKRTMSTDFIARVRSEQLKRMLHRRTSPV